MAAPRIEPAEHGRRPTFTRRHYLGAGLVFTICAALLASPWLTGRVTIPWDAKAHFYPQLVFLANALHGPDSPFWNPHVFAGSPQIADPQSLIFTLPYLLLALFDRAPGLIAADAVVFVTLALAGLAILAFFRDRGWHPAGGLVAALSFAFGGSAAWRIQHIGEVLSIAFFVITLWLLSRALDRNSWKAGLGAGFFAGLMVIGRDQIAWLCTLVLIGVVLWHVLAGAGRVARLRAALPALLLAFLVGSLVIVVPIALTIALAEQSTRVMIDYAGAARGSLHPAALLTSIVANLYGVDGPNNDFWGPPSTLVWGENQYVLARNMGAIYFGALPIVALVAVGVMRGVLWSREIRVLTVALVAMLLYALGDFTPFFRLAFEIPGSDLFRRPADATFPLCALASLLAGYAVHRMLTRDIVLRPMHLAPVILAFAVALAIAVLKGRIAQAALPLVIAAACLVVSAALLLLARRFSHGRSMLLLAAIGACMTADLAINNGPNESTALPPAHFDVMRRETQNDTIALLRKKLDETNGPDRRDRVELAAVGFDWPNLGMIHGFDHDLGYNPVRQALYAAATGAQDHVAVPDQRQFSPLFPSYRSLLADMLGVRFIATGVPAEQIDRKLAPGDLVQLARTKDAYVYENPRALPRVLFAHRAQAADFDSLLKTGDWPQFDPRETVLLPSVTEAAPLRPGVAQLTSYANTAIRVAVDSPDGGWVVLNDLWHPWWRAEIDGVRAPILQANVLFRAVRVPAGRHEVRFIFTPFEGLLARLRAGPGHARPEAPAEAGR